MNSLFSTEERKAAELAADKNAGHPFWKPVIEGDCIEGLYLGSRSRKNDYGDQTVATIDAYLGISDGTSIEMGKFDVGLTTVLKDRFQDAQPVAGLTWIAIEYTGKVMSKNNKEYNNFTVLTKPAPPELQVAGLDDKGPQAGPTAGAKIVEGTQF